jgi:hypothetical protein
MNNSDQISQILTIVLVSMLALLAVLVLIYLVILMKNKKQQKELDSNNQENNQLNNNKKNKKETTKKIESYSKQSIYDFMEFDKIEDNMIIQKNGLRYVMVLQCQGVNYDLLSQAEKVGVEEGFLQFLNTLRYPIQLYIQTRTVNLDNSLASYKQNVNEIEVALNKNRIKYQANVNSGAYTAEELKKQYYEIVKQTNLLEYGKDIIANTERMSKNRNVLNNKYYLVIYYYPEEINENLDKSEIAENAFSELYTRAQSITRALYSCSVSSKIMSSEELAELLYVAYNRDESETFDFEKAMKSGYQELYSTAPDIWNKKLQVLNKQIEEKAFEMANNAIEEVKSERQKQYELKSNSIEDLAREMAALMIDENDSYIGEDIAEEAIKKLNNKIDQWEEETKDEKQEKPKSRRGRKPKNATTK